MAIPLVPILVVGGLITTIWTTGRAAEQGARFLDEANDSTRLALYAGGAYIAYKVAKRSKVI